MVQSRGPLELFGSIKRQNPTKVSGGELDAKGHRLGRPCGAVVVGGSLGPEAWAAGRTEGRTEPSRTGHKCSAWQCMTGSAGCFVDPAYEKWT